MLEFSQKHGISMEDINKVGHNYRYRAGTVSYSQSWSQMILICSNRK